MSFLSGIINIGREIEHGIEQVGHAVSNAVSTVEHKVEQSIATTATSRPIMDLGAMMRRQQLQAGLSGNRSVSSVAAVSATPKSSGGFFSGLSSFLSDIGGKLASYAVSGLTSLLPAPLVQAGINVASKIFGGQGGQGIDPELAGHLQAFGIDPRAIASARVFYNSPNAIPGYATTLGTDIHFGSTPDPKYWVAANELQRLIKSGASAEAIHQAQDKLRESISDFALIAHETNHVAQFKSAGPTGFASRYASDFAGGFVSRILNQALTGNLDTKKIFDLNDDNAPLGGAYRGVSYEQESYHLENDIIIPNLEAQYESLLNYQS